jgi:hypothetical protein
MAINMELGVCIHGSSPLPEQVERHFDDLIARGDLQVFERAGQRERPLQ